MAAPRRVGISYSRFSDPKQAHGDSEGSQERDFRDFCTRHNLTPLAEVFADRGKSGYKDEHRKKGRLGQLIAMAKDGRFDPGTVIVVEAWDRLGRLRPDRQTELVSELVRTGVSIGVCRLNEIFSEDDFGTHKWTTLAVFIQLAFQESKQKAERVAASWQRRRDRAREEGGLLCRRLPAWMEMAGDKPRLIPERAAAVRRIFDLAAAGKGHKRIISTLEKEKVPPFGKVVVNPGRTRSQFSGKWTKPYVALILRDRRAMGEMQPRTEDGKPDGPPIVNYFPAVVTEAQFLLARAGQEKRTNGHAPRQGKHVNVFKGLLRHARDGEGWVLHNKKTQEHPELILVNARGDGGRGKCYTFPYPVFEDAILRRLREVDSRNVLPREKDTATEADVLRARLVNVRNEIARLQEDLKEGYSKALAAVLREREAEEERVAEQLQDELAKSVRPAARAWKDLPGLANMIAEAADPDDVRLRLRPVLRRVVEEVWVLIVPRGSYRLCAVQVCFVGGAQRDYLIVHQTAGYRRKGGCWEPPVSPRWEQGNAPLDLRKREDTKKVEALLESLDLDGLAGTEQPEGGPKKKRRR